MAGRVRVSPPPCPRRRADPLRGTSRLPAVSSEADTVPMVPKTHWAKTIDDAYIAYQDFGEGPSSW